MIPVQRNTVACNFVNVSVMVNNGKCTICGHGMLEHGCDDGVGWCGGSNKAEDCPCKEKGLTYEEELMFHA